MGGVERMEHMVKNSEIVAPLGLASARISYRVDEIMLFLEKNKT